MQSCHLELVVDLWWCAFS